MADSFAAIDSKFEVMLATFTERLL